MISSQPYMPHVSDEGVRQLPQTDTWAKGCVERRLVKRRAELQMRPFVWTILSAVRSGRSGKVRFGKLRAGCRHYECHWGPYPTTITLLPTTYPPSMAMRCEESGRRGPTINYCYLAMTWFKVTNTHVLPMALPVSGALASCSPSSVIAASCHAQLFHRFFP